jgi:hypothetical protein
MSELDKIRDELIRDLWEKVKVYQDHYGSEYIGGVPVQFLASRIEAYEMILKKGAGVGD